MTGCITQETLMKNVFCLQILYKGSVKGKAQHEWKYSRTHTFLTGKMQWEISERSFVLFYCGSSEAHKEATLKATQIVSVKFVLTYLPTPVLQMLYVSTLAPH